MRWLTNSIAWIYDFLAEDIVLLVGAALALGVAALAVHTVHGTAAGIILFVFVVLVISASIIRTAR